MRRIERRQRHNRWRHLPQDLDQSPIPQLPGGDVKLSREELQALEVLFPANATAGLRYPEEVMKLLDQ